MAKINLLPWREAYRQEKKREFLGVIAGVGLAAVFGAYVWVSSVQNAIENQNARNQLLNQEIAKLDAQVKEISEIKKVRDDLLARIKVITDLEGTRPVIVRYFDELARAIPDGVWLSSAQRVGKIVTIEGVAESYNRIASFLRNLESSDWYASHNLISVDAAPEEGEDASRFKMTVETSAPAELTADPAKPVGGAQ
ncbi:PilN domain-containing protein [Cellvibrio sp. NN19]|uniref:PilN domain-containing protein n=1 Tax=Cellvibrio chitinivorans TaxID=3102792 RepID=UPI002B4091C3|nr:PilN domain-containing protein [Cellvibrio sp. NN19]